ncbi:hypothetical protein PIB30_038931 [Stylosanthes scabra]|uniref:Uncharacterized protein n=1 Tax=Stylosanthes scabra TaxID=79078 RepID=A0ABU6SE08_9FABA|nr:hypothetical protein [Stylosanthes scabra]
MANAGHTLDEVHPSKHNLQFCVYVVRLWEVSSKYNVKEVQSIEMVVEDCKSLDDVLDTVTTMEAKTPGTSASTPMTKESPALTQPEENANFSTNRAKRARVKRQKFMFEEDDS